MNKTFKCMIRTVSPVHIGCGEVYEPTGFVVDEKNNTLIQFDPFVFILNLNETEREQLSRICCRGDLPSIIQLYKFFQGKPAEGRKIKLADGFVDHYRETLKIPENNPGRIAQELNKFAIERTAFRSGDTRPYLPGSSIKGALRTGYLNFICNGKKIEARDIEKILLDYGRIEEDPFSLVKVSDFQPAGKIQTKILYAVNQKKKASDIEPSAIHQIFEIIEPGAVFVGDITIRDAPPGSPVKKPVELETFLSGAHEFYKKEHARESLELSGVNIPAVKLPEMNKDNLLLRIGRHSGAESVTIRGNRNIKIMRGKEKPLFIDHATTFWLASDRKKTNDKSALIPFGWTYIQGLDHNLEKDVENLEKAWQNDQADMIKEKDALIKAAERETELARIKEAEEQAKLELERQAEEKRKKDLEEMAPEDRELFEIFDSGPPLENKVVDLFNRLDGMVDPFKNKSAERIKDYYIKSGKWNKKDITKKQLEKVKKLKSILGEN